MPRHIEQRRLGWYAVLNVPADVQKLLKRKRFRVSLKTRDKKVAERLANAQVAEWQHEIALARGEVAGRGVARYFREELQRANTSDDRFLVQKG